MTLLLVLGETMQLQTLKELEDFIGGRPKFQLRQKKVRLSFYLGMRECEYLKAYATTHELSNSEIVRGQLKPLLKKAVA